MSVTASIAEGQALTPVTAWAVGSKEAALAALRPWWAQRVERSGLGDEWLDVESAVDAVAPEPLPRMDSNAALPYDAHALGLSYVEALPAGERSEHGRHYTPSQLAQQLWAMAREALGYGVDTQRLHGLVRDPAVGAGALLVPVLREHLKASRDTDPAFVLASLPQFIEGIDTDPWAVYVANVILAAEMLPTLARVAPSRRHPLPALARVGNSLEEDLSPALVWIMNPPYGRQRISAAQRARFADSLFGHANLYGMFMATAIRGVTGEGVVAALVPTSFFSGLYFHRLREQLSERAPLRSLSFVHNRAGVFGGVLQETCLAVFTPRRVQRAEISRVRVERTPVAKVPSPRTSKPWLLPRESADAALAAAAAVMPLTLGASGWRASTGPLVWNRRRADLHSRPSVRRAYVLWAADIDGGKLHRDRGRDSHRYLALRDATDAAVNTLSQPAVLVQRTTAPEQTRRIVAVQLTEDHLSALGGRVVVENHLNVLRPTVDRPLVSLEALGRVLATATFDRLMRCISGSVAVSAYELEALPLPSIEVLASWETLQGDELETAVAAAYRPRASR
jgi:adenine-specific DNA-methyltransferase